MRKWCNEAGLPHGLRKAGAAIAAENGATELQLMAIFGWKTIQEAERYTRAARRKKMAGDAMPLMRRPKEDRESKSGTKFPTADEGRFPTVAKTLILNKEKKRWRSLRESNPSFKIENLAS